MRKTLLPLFVVLFSFSFLFAQDNASEKVHIDKSKLENILNTRVIKTQPNLSLLPIEAELFTSGTPINDPGNGPSGSDGSVLQDDSLGHTTLGAGWQSSLPNTIADDFDVAGANWSIDSILVYGYQTGSAPTPSTFTDIYVRVWNAKPGTPGASVIWGDLTTNLFGSSSWTGAYRYAQSNVGTTRPVQKIIAHISGLTLSPGKYWLEVTAAGTGASGPWMPPITITGQAVTGDALQYTNEGDAWGPLTDGATDDPQGMAFTIYGETSAAVGPDPASDPIPANAAIDLPINGNSAAWTNPAGTLTNVAVYFGTDGALVTANDASVKVYDGTPINTLSLAAVEPLSYYTEYFWRVVLTDATGSTNSQVWSFKTEEDPSIITLYSQDFESGTIPADWTIVNANGDGYAWDIYTSASYNHTPGGENSLAIRWNSAAAMDDWAFYGPINFDQMNIYELKFWYKIASATYPENLKVTLNTDTTAASMVTTLIDLPGLLNVDYEQAVIPFTPASTDDFYIGFHGYSDADMFRIAIDDILVRYLGVVPVELTSFTASASDAGVTLNWATATETNNSGFSIERSVDNVEFNSIAFVDGNGTTTEKSNYTFVDNSVVSGKVYYRLKQIDFDGTFAYTSTVEVDLNIPTDYSVSQNYPNPFNPTTTIKFGLPVDAKVTISIYNTLGQRVSQIVNTDFAAGKQNVEFNATHLASGVYIYTVEAIGVDGTNFTSTKKMMLMK